jgi:hypothetical protein
MNGKILRLLTICGAILFIQTNFCDAQQFDICKSVSQSNFTAPSRDGYYLKTDSQSDWQQVKTDPVNATQVDHVDLAFLFVRPNSGASLLKIASLKGANDADKSVPKEVGLFRGENISRQSDCSNFIQRGLLRFF